MIFKELTNHGIMISALGQGTIGAGSRNNATDERRRCRERLLRQGIELGMTFLDTGEDYEDGHAEEILGRVVFGIRDQVFVGTKMKPSNHAFKDVIAAAEGSLRRLKTDYIDIYQIQWSNPSVPLTETLDAMMYLVDQGKVRFIGVGNFTTTQLREAIKHVGNKLISVQTEYNLFNRDIEKNLLPECERSGITIIAYSPLRQWYRHVREQERMFLQCMAKKYDATIAQIILAWIIAHKSVVALAQTMNIDHQVENAQATSFRMEPDDIAAINDTFHRDVSLIVPSRICVVNEDADEAHLIYTSIEDAVNNALNIQPAPAILAEELIEGEILKPVQVVPTVDQSGKYDYDLTHGRMRYWAWIIAFGPAAPIPAYIIGATEREAELA
jgi:diketogulonate reductase-like aldo/keto reductase